MKLRVQKSKKNLYLMFSDSYENSIQTKNKIIDNYSGL